MCDGLSDDIDARINAFTLSEIDLALGSIDDCDVEADLFYSLMLTP